MGDGGRAGAAPLAMGTVLGRAFGVMSGNPVTVFAIAFLFGALPQQVLSYFGQVETGGNAAAQLGMSVLTIGYVLAFVLCSALSQAALVRATSAYLDGHAAGIGECVRSGISKVLPVIGLSILLALGIIFGFALLIVPGVILFLMWSVSIPALVEEDVGVIGAFGRSRALTKGARWSILGIVVVATVITWLLSAVAIAPALILSGGASAEPASPATIVLSLVSSTIVSALWSTLLTSLYFTLRERREGPQVEQLADVFA